MKPMNYPDFHKIISFILIGVLCISSLTGCSFLGYRKPKYAKYSPPAKVEPKVSELPVIELSDQDAYELAQRYLETMSVEEKIGQVFIVNLEQLDNRKGDFYEFKKTTKEMKKTLLEYPVGGIILFSRNTSTRKKTKKLIRGLQKASQTPLFVTVDEEGGDVARIASNKKMKTTVFPSAEEIGKKMDGNYVYEMGRTIAGDIRRLGFNVDFAPVADVKTKDDNTEIGNRSFGSDPQKVSEMVGAFVQGCQEKGVSATLKHFPGQGSSEGDTHKDSVDIDSSISTMRKVDFLPFQAGIEAGADFIMVSHISVSRVTETKEPASMSELVMTTILRDELQFRGVIITDAMDMASIVQNYSSGEAAYNAFRAGADVVLMPQNYKEAYQYMLSKVNDGTITMERLEESVLRILQTKFKRGMMLEEDITKKIEAQNTASPDVTQAPEDSPANTTDRQQKQDAKSEEQ